jgi:hypothetical protein
MTRWAASCAGWPTGLVCPFNPFGYYRRNLDKVQRRRVADGALSSSMSERSPDLPLTQRTGERRRVIPASCALDRGPAESTNLLVSIRGATAHMVQHGHGRPVPHIIAAMRRDMTTSVDGLLWKPAGPGDDDNPRGTLHRPGNKQMPPPMQQPHECNHPRSSPSVPRRRVPEPRGGLLFLGCAPGVAAD